MLHFFRMMVNSFGSLSERVHLFSPGFFTEPPRSPRSYEDKDWFAGRLAEILKVRKVTEDFWQFDYHVCVINDSNHWFAIVAKISEERCRNGRPKNIALHSLDSLRDK